MRTAVLSAVHSLSSSLESSHRNATSTLTGISSSIHEMSREQSAAMRELNHSARETSRELYHQTWGHYPLLS